jgi:uncharacterized protein (UPF0332 family)
MDEKVLRILNEARQALSDADFNYLGGRYHVVSNRAYYAVFHCIQALLQSEGVFVKTHQGAQQKFHQLFIKTGKLPMETGEIPAYLSELRNLSDYDYGTAISVGQAENAIRQAKTFLEAAEGLFS